MHRQTLFIGGGEPGVSLGKPAVTVMSFIHSFILDTDARRRPPPPHNDVSSL